MANLDNAQLIVLRDDITITNAATLWEGTSLLDWWNSGQNQPLAEYYWSFPTTPVSIWRNDLDSAEAKLGIDWTEFLTIGTNEVLTYRLLFNGGGDGSGVLDLASANNRNAILEIFSGPQRASTRQGILGLGIRDGNNGELLYTTGPFSADTVTADVSAIFGQLISAQNVAEARLV